MTVVLLEFLSPPLLAQEGQPEVIPENTVPVSEEPVKEKGDSDGMKLPEVVVQEEQEQEDEGYAVDDASTATKTDTPIIDIPQSIQVVPHRVIEDQRATSLTEILRNVSGFSPSVNSQSQRFGDRDIIFRGFVTNNYFTNGYKNAFNGSSFSFGIANIDRVEVLKGPIRSRRAERNGKRDHETAPPVLVRERHAHRGKLRLHKSLTGYIGAYYPW
jgi:iron complex outermembrane receptor protein